MTRLFLLLTCLLLSLLPSAAPAVDFNTSVGHCIFGGFGDNITVSGTDWNPTIGTSLYLSAGSTNWIVGIMQTMSLHSDGTEPLCTVGEFNYVFAGKPRSSSFHAGFGGIVSRVPEIKELGLPAANHGGVEFQIGASTPFGASTPEKPARSYHTMKAVIRWIDGEGYSAGVVEQATFDFP